MAPCLQKFALVLAIILSFGLLLGCSVQDPLSTSHYEHKDEEDVALDAHNTAPDISPGVSKDVSRQDVDTTKGDPFDDQDTDPDAQNNSDIDATSPPQPRCDDGVENGQETDTDCGGLDCPPCELGQRCQLNTDCSSDVCHDETCVECVDDDHCGQDQACSNEFKCVCKDSRSTQEICAAKSSQCGEVTDICGETVECGPCTGDTVCADSLCVGCNSNEDCDSGFCDQDAQVCVDCRGDDDCQGCQRCSESGFCVSDDDRCSGCQTCSSGVCTDNHNNCSGDENYCADALCVECTSNNHCDGGYVCSSNSCVECTNSGHCPGEQQCLENQCVDCTSNGHCSDGEHCVDNQCICPTPSQCTLNQCGIITNACGASRDCRDCAGEFHECNNNQCVCNDTRTNPQICAANNVECGQTQDACGNTVLCQSCPQFHDCIDNQCVCNDRRGQKLICTTNNVECGPTQDACGNIVSCKSCPQGKHCLDGQCVECISNDDCSHLEECGEWGPCMQKGRTCAGERSRSCSKYTCQQDNTCQLAILQPAPEKEICNEPPGSRNWSCDCQSGPSLPTALGYCQAGECCNSHTNTVCGDSGGFERHCLY